MSDNLDVVILDDDPLTCSLIKDILEGFYVWGKIHTFTDYQKALSYCKKTKLGTAIFILDVYLGKNSAFDFLDAVSEGCPWASEDTIIITGHASDDIVNLCIASNITQLLDTPIKGYTLKLAVRAIASTYILFAKRILGNAEFAKNVARR